MQRLCERVNYFVLYNKEAPKTGEKSELTAKEKAYIASPSPPSWQEIATLRTAFNCLLTRYVEKTMKYTRQRFEHGDKAGRCLAYHVTKCAESQTITTVSDTEGHKVYETKLINV